MTIFPKIFLLLFSFFIFNTEPNIPCHMCKKGMFIMHEKNNPNIGHWKGYDIFIERNDTIEKSVVSIIPTDTTFSKVRWLSNCTYEREFMSSSSGYFDSALLSAGKRLLTDTVTINEGGSKYYLQQSGNGIDTVWVKELWITLEGE